MMMFAAILCSALALDASQSTISGVASGDSLVINQTYTVTVQAKDTFGKNLFSGGEDIYAYITDPCTRGPNMSCVPSAFNQSAVNGGEKIIKLSDLRNGKYSTDFDLNHIGDATISIILAHRQAVVGKYYNSGGISGLPDVVTSSPDINFSWAAGQDITPGNSNNVSAQFTAKLISFQSGNCTVSATQDDGADVKINGVAHVSNYGINKASSTSFDYNFNAFETYDLKIDWKNLAGPGVIKLYWQCVGDKIIIPPKNYGYAEDLGASLLQVSVVCPKKYEQTPSTTDQCRPICGDGYVISPEVCDDNNAVSGDGCSTDCTVESGYVCAGGDSENKDTCRLWSTGFYTNDSVRPTECITKCGDGQRVGSEACDDGNTIDDDGCSSDCSEIELAWKCGTSVPNICTRDYKSVPLTSIERALQIGTLVAIPILILINIIRGSLNNLSTNSVLSPINQLQLLMLFLLCETFIPLRVVTYLRTITVSLIDINIDWSFFIVFRKIIEWFDFAQPRDDFDTIEISSGSSLINLSTLVCMFILYIIVHFMFWGIKKCMGKSK